MKNHLFSLFILLLSLAVFAFSANISCDDDDDDDDSSAGDDDDDDDDDASDDDGGDDDDNGWENPCFDEGETLVADPPGTMVYAVQRGNFIFFYSPGVLETIPETFQAKLGDFDVIQVAGSGAHYKNGSAVMLPEGTDVSCLEGLYFLGIYPLLQVDGNGKFHLVYIDHLNGKLKYAQNTTGSFEVEVIADGFSDYGYLMAFDVGPSGQPHILHYNFDPMNYYHKQNNKWVVETIDSVPWQSLTGFDLAVDMENVAHIVYAKDDGATLMLSSNTSGTQTPAELVPPGLPTVSEPNYKSPQIEITSAGARIIAFSYGDRNKYSGNIYVVTESQDSWKTEKAWNNVGVYYFTLGMELNSLEEPVLLWWNYGYSLLHKPEGVWKSESVMDCDGGSHQLLLDETGEPHVIYPCQIGDYSDSALEVRSRFRVDGQWQTALASPGGAYINRGEVRMADHPEGGFVSLTVDAMRNLIFSQESEDVWETESFFQDEVGAYEEFALALDADGFPMAVVMDATQIRYFSKSSGSWVQEESWNEKFYGGTGIDLIVDSQGYPHIVYLDEREALARQIFFDGTQWTQESILTAQYTRAMRAGFDSADHMHIVYLDLFGLHHIYEQNDEWHSETITEKEFDEVELRLLPNNEMVVLTGGYGSNLCLFSGTAGDWSENCQSVGFHSVGLAIGSNDTPLAGGSLNQQKITIYRAVGSDWSVEKISAFGGINTDMAIDNSGQVCLATTPREALTLFCADEDDLF